MTVDADGGAHGAGAGLPGGAGSAGLGHVLVVSFLILSLTMVASSVVMRAVHVYGERHDVPFAVAGLSRTLIRALVYGVGLSILLAFLGIAITPIWTALGVGG